MPNTWKLGRASVALLAFSAACAGPGTFTWVSDLPREYTSRASPNDYVINDGDTVNIRVFNQDNMSIRARVRTDGKLAVPVLGDVDVRGKRPSALKAELEARLKDYVNAPSVTITVEDLQPISVAVLGEVAHPGAYPVDPRATVAHVLATAGGLTDYASRSGIYVVRAAPGQQTLRVRFRYEEISRGAPTSAGFALRSGDLLVVE